MGKKGISSKPTYMQPSPPPPKPPTPSPAVGASSAAAVGAGASSTSGNSSLISPMQYNECSDSLSTYKTKYSDCNDTLKTRDGQLTTCTNTLSTRDGQLTTCNTNLEAKKQELDTCTGNLEDCNTNLNAQIASNVNTIKFQNKSVYDRINEIRDGYNINDQKYYYLVITRRYGAYIATLFVWLYWIVYVILLFALLNSTKFSKNGKIFFAVIMFLFPFYRAIYNITVMVWNFLVDMFIR